MDWITGIIILIAVINIYLFIRLRIVESKVDYIDDFLYDKFNDNVKEIGSFQLDDFLNMIKKFERKEEEDGEE